MRASVIAVISIATLLASSAVRSGEPLQLADLPFGQDIDVNLDFLLALQEETDIGLVTAHVETLFARLGATLSEADANRWRRQLLTRLSKKEIGAPMVRVLLLKALATSWAVQGSGQDTSRSAEAVGLALSSCDAGPCLAAFSAFSANYNDNILYHSNRQLYARYCATVAKAYAVEGEESVAAYWEQKAFFSDPDLEASDKMEMQKQPAAGWHFLVFLSGCFFFFVLCVAAGMVSPTNGSPVMGRFLPKKLQRRPVVLWGIIVQAVFVCYVVLQKWLTGSFDQLFFPLTLTLSTLLLVWGHFKFHQLWINTAPVLRTMFDLDERWSETVERRMFSVRNSVAFGVVWGIGVALFISIASWPGHVAMKIFIGVFIFFVNFWTGVTVYQIVVIAISIFALRKRPLRHAIGLNDDIYGIGSVVLTITIVMMLYTTACLTAFKLTGAEGLDVYFSAYLGLAIVGLTVFFLGLPFTMRSKLVAYKNEYQESIKRKLAIEIGRVLDGEQAAVERAAELNIKFKAVLDGLEAIPNWPVNVRIVSSFMSVIILPVAMIVYDLFTNADSIFYNMDRLEIFSRLLR